MIRPFDKSPFPNYLINLIATYKYVGKKCLIIELSFPHNGAAQRIDSLIPLATFSLFYAIIENAIKLITQADREAWLTKTISGAFTSIAVAFFWY